MIVNGFSYAHAQVPPEKWTQNYTLSDIRAAFLQKEQNTVTASLTGKVDTLNGTSTNQKLTSPQLIGGMLDGSQTIPSSVSSRTLSDHFRDIINVKDYGAKGDGSTDDGPAVSAAISAAGNGGTILFPYSDAGYVLNRGYFPQTQTAIYDLRGNHFTGAAIGHPEEGTGLFNASFTNPWNITTGSRRHYDPAAYGAQKNSVTFQGEATTCSPNHPVQGDEINNRHWIACIYRGADTGSGGAPGTSINTEVDNDVLNLGTNSGVGYEIDVNVNDDVKDGGIQRGIFITGGGGAGRYWNGVGLDIQHGTYDGTSSLDWGTGISVRNAHHSIEAHSEKDGAGFLYLGFNNQDNEVYHVDTNGYISATGMTLKGAATTTTVGVPAYTADATHADDYVAQKNSASDSGFFWRSFDEHGQQTSMIDKNGFATFSGVVAQNNLVALEKFCLDSTCSRYIYESNNKVYIGNSINGTTASIDDKGTMTLKGQLIQNGNP